MIQRIALVAKRDFVTTVGSKGFLVGLLIMPLLILAIALIAPRILSSQSPQVQGEVAVIDPTGSVVAELRSALDPATIAERRAKQRVGAGRSGPPSGAPIPKLTVVERPANADLQREKSWLIQAESATPRHLALVVIRRDAVTRGVFMPEFGTYELYVTKTLNEATENAIHDALAQSLVALRLRSSGLDQRAIESTMRVVRPNSVIVAAAGEQAARRGFARMLPFLCGLLLFMNVIMGGQMLMGSTIEEKSSRVVEVLLAAVSPIELMWGKLIGQLGVGLLMMVVYVGLGLFTLSQYSLLSLVDPMLVFYLIVFYLIAYLVYGALMMSIGAAVSQMADAQSLMGPVMILLVLPYLFVQFIGQAPNSTFSITMSFLPPINTFAMLARVASSTPPPLWQVALSVLVGLLTAAGTVWFAAKVFKIGLLMHGKPPTFGTLIRWVRMA